MVTASRVGACALVFGAAIGLCPSIATLYSADTDGKARKGTVERIKVHGKALEANLEG